MYVIYSWSAALPSLLGSRLLLSMREAVHHADTTDSSILETFVFDSFGQADVKTLWEDEREFTSSSWADHCQILYIRSSHKTKVCMTIADYEHNMPRTVCVLATEMYQVNVSYRCRARCPGVDVNVQRFCQTESVRNSGCTPASTSIVSINTVFPTTQSLWHYIWYRTTACDVCGLRVSGMQDKYIASWGRKSWRWCLSMARVLLVRTILKDSNFYPLHYVV